MALAAAMGGELEDLPIIVVVQITVSCKRSPGKQLIWANSDSVNFANSIAFRSNVLTLLYRCA